VASLPFDSLYRHGFVRVALGVPAVRVADPAANVERTLELARRAADDHAALAVFPELGLSGYTADDLFHQQALHDAVGAALQQVIDESHDLGCVLAVGAPLVVGTRLFNCAVVVHRGTVLGVVPKSYLPNYREFYEKRQFAAARDRPTDEITVAGQIAPFGDDLLFEATDAPGLVLHVELCEDVWVPVPPSTWAALAGATVLVNLSASNALVSKADYRRQLCASQSARCLAAYLYAAAGPGESTTDLAWDGHALAYENGERLAESARFSGEHLLTADVDLERLAQDRLRMTTFTDAAHDHRARLRTLRRVPFEAGIPSAPVPLRREIPRFPYVPADPARRNERCAEVYEIQVQGLATRLAATGIDKVVIGVSGGLDSTQALLVAVRAMGRLGHPAGNVLGYTMPGFATSARSLGNAHRLMAALVITAHEIDIRPSARQMLADLGHPAADGHARYDVTYENVQAGERTSHLFRLANQHRALVVGTGDLSELALGWCTYGVGDQMSHYNVNASVPKTLVQYLIRSTADTAGLGPEAETVLADILATEISPELVPTTDGAGGGRDQPAQRSEDVVGPYELQDLHLYYLLRFGYRPSRVAYLAHRAWGDRTRGVWPDLVPGEQRREYDLATIKHWLAVFLYRFVETSQFKRSALPNGPKVGSGGSLSPRGDWRAPSDASARAWLDQLAVDVPD
jgi:NAD+ synthase (glutamine-hydrolysing)